MKKNTAQKWTRRRSELNGFTTALYTTDTRGDYVRADCNSAKGIVRLTVEDRSERRFHSEVIRGAISREWAVKSSASKVPAILKGKAAVYSMIPDQKVLRIVSGCYGIGFVTQRDNARKKQKKAVNVLPLIIFLSLLIIAVTIITLFIR